MDTTMKKTDTTAQICRKNISIYYKNICKYILNFYRNIGRVCFLRLEAEGHDGDDDEENQYDRANL